jgi:hypothetical protein
MTDSFLAFLRRCLAKNIPVWVVGDLFPQSLTDLKLEPGTNVIKFPLEELGYRLAQLKFQPQGE